MSYIADKFKSGNSIPVSRATITRAELEAHDKAIRDKTIDECAAHLIALNTDSIHPCQAATEIRKLKSEDEHE